MRIRYAVTLNTRCVGYVLLIYCPNNVVMRVGSLGETSLCRGMYLYVGSANIRNPVTRVLRHFGKGKKMHWHVDYLTEKCIPFLASLCFGRGEDYLYDLLVSLDVVKPAVLGFGSSDRVLHKTHLFKLLAEDSTAIVSLIDTLVKTCNRVEVISISDRFCLSRVLRGQL